MKEIDPVALFRLSVLGQLVSRTQLARGELQAMLRELASKEYDIPGSRRRQVAEKTLQIWFYRYRREGLAGLAPKQRCDHGRSKISTAVQERLLAAKRENPRRSLHMLQQLLEDEGVVKIVRDATSNLSRDVTLSPRGIARIRQRRGRRDRDSSPRRRWFAGLPRRKIHGRFM